MLLSASTPLFFFFFLHTSSMAFDLNKPPQYAEFLTDLNNLPPDDEEFLPDLNKTINDQELLQYQHNLDGSVFCGEQQYVSPGNYLMT
jgi:hypothetical protein